MQVCCADKLSNCKAQLYDFKQIGKALFERFNKESTPELQAWYYKGVVNALKPLEGMQMYEELKEAVPSAQRIGVVKKYNGGKYIFLQDLGFIFK